MRKFPQIIAMTALCLVMAASTVGCKPIAPSYNESTKDYTASTAGTLFEQVPKTEALGQPTTQSEELRHKALVALRGLSAGAAEAADLITKTFPVETRGVPVLVERALFEGKPALLVLEVTGPPQGSLVDTRLWVIGEAGDVFYSEVR